MCVVFVRGAPGRRTLPWPGAVEVSTTQSRRVTPAALVIALLMLVPIQQGHQAYRAPAAATNSVRARQLVPQVVLAATPAGAASRLWTGVNSDGRLEIFLRGGDGQLWHAFETQAGNSSSWSGFYALGGSWANQAVVASNADGRLEVFMRGGDGAIWHAFETQAGNSSSWSGWYSLGGSWPGLAAAGRNSNGRLELFARGGDGQLWHAYETQASNSSSWVGWYAMGGAWPGEPAVAANSDGRLEVAMRGGDGQLWHAFEAQAGNSSSWSAFYALGGAWPSDPTLTANSDGRLEALLLGGDGQLWHVFETQAGNSSSWSGFYALGGSWPGVPAVGLGGNGQLQVLMRGGDGQLWHAYESQAGNSSSWSGFSPFGGSWPTDPEVATNSDGRVEVFLLGGDGALWHAFQSQAGSSTSWSGFYSLGGSWPVQNPPPTRPAPTSIALAVPWYHQQESLTCEEAALRMVLAYFGTAVSEQQILNVEGVDLTHYWTGPGGGDPFNDFVGNPNGSEIANTGYGAYWTPIQRAAAAFGGNVRWAGQGLSPNDVYSAVLAGWPVIFWMPYNWDTPGRNDYVAYDGRTIPYAGPEEHAMVVTGVTPTSVEVNDPDRGQYWVSDSTFVSNYAVYGDMAVVIQS